MITIRQAQPNDLLNIQHSNLLCLPENYKQKYFMFHLMTWPTMSFVAEDKSKNKIAGYVLAKIDEDGPQNSPHGHITSLAVLRPYRRRGIAKQLMEQSCRVMVEMYNANKVSLHVRESNRAAFSLYNNVLRFVLIETEMKYYADGEDGLFMQKNLVDFCNEMELTPVNARCFYGFGDYPDHFKNHCKKEFHLKTDTNVKQDENQEEQKKDGHKLVTVELD